MRTGKDFCEMICIGLRELKRTEIISDMLELMIKVFAVVVEPFLDTFEQIGWEVTPPVNRAAVCLDILEAIQDEALVLIFAHEHSSALKPASGPSDGMDQLGSIAIVVVL